MLLLLLLLQLLLLLFLYILATIHQREEKRRAERRKLLCVYITLCAWVYYLHTHTHSFFSGAFSFFMQTNNNNKKWVCFFFLPCFSSWRAFKDLKKKKEEKTGLNELFHPHKLKLYKTDDCICKRHRPDSWFIIGSGQWRSVGKSFVSFLCHLSQFRIGWESKQQQRKGRSYTWMLSLFLSFFFLSLRREEEGGG